MIVGHLPAGYLAASSLSRILPARALFFGVVLGSVLPDLDLLWFYFVDGGSTHHHGYLFHRPIVWALVLAVGLATKSLFQTGIGLGGLLHMALDTALGKIAWGWPLSDAYATLIVVQPTHDHWILSFMVHWTFQIELALVVAAVILAWRRNRMPKP